MLAQAAGLAVLAALTPAAILVIAVLLTTPDPHRTALIFLTGAIIMTVVMALAVFFVLRATHLQIPTHRTPRFGLRLGLGLAALLAGGYLWRRGPKPPDPSKPSKGVMSRLLAKPGSKTAFLLGMIVYTPSVMFLAAVQVVATARASDALTVAGIVVVVIVTVAFVWLPLILYLVAPARTTRLLAAVNGTLRAHGYVITVAALLVGGVILAINGILGVTGVLG